MGDGADDEIQHVNYCMPVVCSPSHWRRQEC
jgi:hypothetical protein